MLKDNIHRFKTLWFFCGLYFWQVQSGCKVTPSSISLSLLSQIIFPFSPDNSTSSSAKPLITRELFWQPLTTPLKSPKCEVSQVSLLSSHCLPLSGDFWLELSFKCCRATTVSQLLALADQTALKEALYKCDNNATFSNRESGSPHRPANQINVTLSQRSLRITPMKATQNWIQLMELTMQPVRVLNESNSIYNESNSIQLTQRNSCNLSEHYHVPRFLHCHVIYPRPQIFFISGLTNQRALSRFWAKKKGGCKLKKIHCWYYPLNFKGKVLPLKL